MSRFCMSCGAANSDTASICLRCGKNLDITAISKDSSKPMNQFADHEEYILKPNTILEGRYYIKRVIGEGGFGITYEAVNEKIDMTVAIKELYCREYVHRDVTKSDDIKFTYATAEESFNRAKKRFLQEAKTLSGFGDEGAIVKVLDYFEENGTAYIVMNYLHGISLDKYLEKNGPMKWEIMIEKIKPLVATLERVHNRGVIHRDISSSNIMVLENGSLCLLDFGAAKDILKKDHKTSAVFTKQGYTPIEQYAHDGNVGSWSDVYALSAVCYECLTGVCPPDSLQRSIYDEYKSLKEQGKETTGDLDALLKRGLAVKVENRYANMGQMLKAMNELTAKKKGKKSKKIVAVMLVIFILLGAGSIFFYKNYREEFIFQFRETESFRLVRDEGTSIDDFNTDVQRIEERIKKIVGENPYIWEEEGDTLCGVVPLECLGEEDPREIIRDLIVRPNEWTISGVEIDRKYIEDINYSDKNRQELVIKLAENTPKETQDDLAHYCEEVAELSLDNRYNNNLTLDGKMNSPLSFTWNVQEQWEDVKLRELFLYNISHDALTVDFTVYSQIQSNWEVRDSNAEFGEKQCDVEELDKNRITLEYWAPRSDTLTEGEATDFITALKDKLDILDIPYAIGRERYQRQRVTLCVNQKDYNDNLFALLVADAGDIEIIDAWGRDLIAISRLENLNIEEAENKTYTVSAVCVDDTQQELEQATERMIQRNVDTYFLAANGIPLLEGKLSVLEDHLMPIQDDVLHFNSINMDNRIIDTDHKAVLELLDYVLSHDDHVIAGYEVFAYQYTNGADIVSSKPEFTRENLLFDTSKETEIVNELKKLSDEYEVKSTINYEWGEKELSILLSSQIYSESVSDHSVFLDQISQIMNTCGIENGTPWANITIGIMSRYEKNTYAGKLMLRHPYVDNDNKYPRPYTISIIGFEKAETKWLKKILKKMETDERFKDYLPALADYTGD